MESEVYCYAVVWSLCGRNGKDGIQKPRQHKMNYIHPTAIIGPNVTMGDGNYIGPGCVIGYPAEHKGHWPKPDDPAWGEVVIGDRNVLTGMVSIDAGTEKPTYIGSDNWFLKHSHVGHDATIGDNVTVSCGAKVGGHCVVRDGVNLGLNAVIHQRVIIPENCMIGMGAVITKKTQMIPQQKYAGNPAKWIGVNEKK